MENIYFKHTKLHFTFHFFNVSISHDEKFFHKITPILCQIRQMHTSFIFVTMSLTLFLRLDWTSCGNLWNWKQKQNLKFLNQRKQFHHYFHSSNRLFCCNQWWIRSGFCGDPTGDCLANKIQKSSRGVTNRHFESYFFVTSLHLITCTNTWKIHMVWKTFWQIHKLFTFQNQKSNSQQSFLDSTTRNKFKHIHV